MTNVNPAHSIEKESGANMNEESEQINKVEDTPDSGPANPMNGINHSDPAGATDASNPSTSLPSPDNQALNNAAPQISSSLNTATVTADGPKRFQKNAQYCGTGRLPCPELGEDWSIEQIVRQQGKSAGRYDTYYYSPTGVKIRSKLKLKEYVDKDLSNFDYNSGKFVDEGNLSASLALPRPKMSLLKTNDLKTIERPVGTSPEKLPATKSPPKKLTIKLPPRKKQPKGPYLAALETLDKKKLRKKQKSKKRKRLPSTSLSVDDFAEDDSAQNNPFDAFKQEAISLSSYFADMEKDFPDLIQFAWNFLSIESKTQFNTFVATDKDSQYATSDCSLDSPLTRKDPSANKGMQDKHDMMRDKNQCSALQEGSSSRLMDSMPGLVSMVPQTSVFGESGCLFSQMIESQRSVALANSSESVNKLPHFSSAGRGSTDNCMNGQCGSFSHLSSRSLKPMMNNIPDLKISLKTSTSSGVNCLSSIQQNNNNSCVSAGGSFINESTNLSYFSFPYNHLAATSASTDEISSISTSFGSNNTESSSAADQDGSSQKLHKRKSRKPVYIRQTSKGNQAEDPT